MDNDSREIDLIQLIGYFFEHIIIICLVGVLCSVLAMGYNYIKQRSVDTDQVKRNTINAIINQNKVASYAPVSQPKPYTYEETISGTYLSDAKLYVEFDYRTLSNYSNNDFTNMTSKFQQDAVQYLLNGESLQRVIDELSLDSYEDMKEITPDDLKWMICAEFSGANVMQFVVTDVDEERAGKILEATINELINNKGDLGNISEVRIIDHPVIVNGSSDNEGGISINKINLAKYGLFGLILGLIIVCGIYCVIYVIKCPIRGGDDFKQLNIRCLGEVPKNDEKKNETVKKISYALSTGEYGRVITYIPVDEYNSRGNIGEVYQAIMKEEGKSVIVLDSLKMNIEEIIETINGGETSDDILFIYSDSFKRSAKTAQLLKFSDSVILGTEYSKTQMGDLEKVVEEISFFDVDIIGAIVYNARK